MYISKEICISRKMTTRANPLYFAQTKLFEQNHWIKKETDIYFGS